MPKIRSPEAIAKHSATYERKRPSKVCECCGVTFKCLPHDLDKRRFCSRACTGKANPGGAKNHTQGFKDTRPCEFCGKSYDIQGASSKNRRFCSVSCKAQWQASLPYEEWRGKLSANRDNRARGKENGMWGRSPNHGKWHTYVRWDNVVFRFRSSWEYVVAQYLDRAGIAWEYESRRFEFKDGKTYVPDFWLPQLETFWEIKGWMNNKSIDKIERFRSEFPHLPLVVVGPHVFKGLKNQIEA